MKTSWWLEPGPTTLGRGGGVSNNKMAPQVRGAPSTSFATSQRRKEGPTFRKTCCWLLRCYLDLKAPAAAPVMLDETMHVQVAEKARGSGRSARSLS